MNFANFANFAKLGVKSFAFREILKTQKISNTNYASSIGIRCHSETQNDFRTG